MKKEFLAKQIGLALLLGSFSVFGGGGNVLKRRTFSPVALPIIP